MEKFVIIFIVLFVCTCFEINSQNPTWELRKNEDGIKVYTRERTDAKSIEFKAESNINASLITVVNILKDVENYHKWMTDLKFAKKIKVVSDNKWYAYYLAEVPWPLEDRDVIYELILFKENESTVLSLNSKPDLIPESENYVRINKAEGKWVFTPKDKNTTHVLYQFYADPEISVPLWIMNMFIVEGPFKTLQNLRSFTMDY